MLIVRLRLIFQSSCTNPAPSQMIMSARVVVAPVRGSTVRVIWSSSSSTSQNTRERVDRDERRRVQDVDCLRSSPPIFSALPRAVVNCPSWYWSGKIRWQQVDVAACRRP
jgi:hypothetical protein